LIHTGTQSAIPFAAFISLAIYTTACSIILPLISRALIQQMFAS